MCMNKPNHRSTWIPFFGLCLIVILLTACGTSKQEMEFTLHSTNRLNPSDSGQPVPVVIRIYTLRDSGRFERATFLELWKRDYEYLGDDLLDRKEITLKPQSKQLVEIRVDKENEENFFGIMGLFRKYQTGTWRTVIPIEKPGVFSFGDPEFYIQVDQYSLREGEPN